MVVLLRLGWLGLQKNKRLYMEERTDCCLFFFIFVVRWGRTQIIATTLQKQAAPSQIFSKID